ncbi:hypothetical protein NGTWS0302_16690 [Mycolicibacterium cyprinidarum]|uniref:ATP-binding protein n=1 Tax=Mycolicibacterium cyprinidarum TaxID=2860311 RepID=A0ABQ4V5A8_9MYCO|nr:hypothetical protein NGTWS1702_34330 [Mycolicibacterium sp. NGTWSNA01]GJF18471.1 hypothetical protein NGTWS0302_16690 [Mycolicibacterium sp. NGTWS0302]
MRSLVNDPQGTALWIEREARGMDPTQMFREFVQNGIEAGATRVVIDGFSSGKRVFARITDNGSGMTGPQMIDRMSHLHCGTTAANYGVGARIASLPSNPAGVEFACRTADGTETAVTLHKERGQYGVRVWESTDEEGDPVKIEEYVPDAAVLEQLQGQSSGTAVVLHGDGRRNTWDSSMSYQVHKFLSRRYFRLGEGHVTVFVEHRGSHADRAQLRRVVPMAEYLNNHGEDCGELEFTDVAGMSGVMRWWILPPAVEQQNKRSAREVLPGGVGLLVGNEVFDYTRGYLGDFGVIYPSVQSRVVLLIEVAGAEQDTARSGVILPGESRKTIPWKKLGAYFAEHMPAEIDDLLSEVTVNPTVLDTELAKALDPEWFKNLNPVRVKRSGGDETGMGTDAGDALPKRETERSASSASASQPQKKTASERGADGDQPATPTLKVMTPQVEFTDQEIEPYGIAWYPTQNKILIYDQFSPYVRELQRWTQKLPGTQPAVIEAAVMSAFSVEYAATIIDANAQKKWQLTPEQVEELKTPAALYAKALGMQSLTSRIEQYIRDTAKRM